MKNRQARFRIANSSDYYSVAVLFADPMITYLFASLLEARGVQTQVIHEVDEIEASVKVITEPKYYSRLSPERQRNCLLVCSQEPREGGALCLSQPLTEDKVEEALALFLSR